MTAGMKGKGPPLRILKNSYLQKVHGKTISSSWSRSCYLQEVPFLFLLATLPSLLIYPSPIDHGFLNGIHLQEGNMFFVFGICLALSCKYFRISLFCTFLTSSYQNPGNQWKNPKIVRLLRLRISIAFSWENHKASPLSVIPLAAPLPPP